MPKQEPRRIPKRFSPLVSGCFKSGCRVGAALLATLALATSASAQSTNAITLSFTNSASIIGPDYGAAEPYPSTLEVSGLPGTITKATARLNGLSHTDPSDFLILLVGPGGQKVLLMANCGETTPANNVTLGFDDAAADALPQTGRLTTGTFQPSVYPPDPVLSSPAPAGPYDIPPLLSAFTGTDPNGTWSLYVYDDAPGVGANSGSISGGWSLTLTLSNYICCAGDPSADLAVTVSDSPDPVLAGSNITYTVRVMNNGPGTASGVVLTDTLAAGAGFASARISQGTTNRSGGVLTWNVGTLNAGALATATIVGSAPAGGGTFTNTAIVTGAQADPNPANNLAYTPATIGLGPVSISINDVRLAEGDLGATQAVFNVTLSRASRDAVWVDYTNANGTALAGSDFIASADTLRFPAGSTNQTITVLVLGDITSEADETFQVRLSNPLGAQLARATGTGTIVNDDGIAGKIDHFSWSTIPTAQSVLTPFPVTLTARDGAGNVVSTYNDAVQLKGLVGGGAEVSVVITELDTGTPNLMEFANVAGVPLDISGWQVTVYDWLWWPDPSFTFTIPDGTTCPANGIFQVITGGTGGNWPGTYPKFFTKETGAWGYDASMNQVAVLLRDATGRIVDFSCAYDADPRAIAIPLPIPTSQWSGSALAANTNTLRSFQRVGQSDNNSGSDWVVATRTTGTLNAGLTRPFSGALPVSITPNQAGPFVSGVWSGTVTVLQGMTNLYLRASDLAGHTGSSGSFTVTPTNHLPSLAALSDRSLDEETLLSLTASATDADPGQTLTFSLVSPPSGMSIHSSSGLLTWTPTEAQGPSTNVITVRVTDNGTPNLSDTRSFTAVVKEVNRAPVLLPMADQTSSPGLALVLTNSATDPDLPTNLLTFSLVASPAGAAMTTHGVFTWTPTAAQAPSTNVVTVRVSDNGSPSLSATQTFKVAVLPAFAPELVINRITRVPGVADVHYTAAAGYSYAIEYRAKESTGAWTTLTNLAAPTVFSNVVISDVIGVRTQRLFRVRNLTVPFQPPRITQAGRAGEWFHFQFGGEAGRTYAVECRDSLTAGQWATYTNVSLPPVTNAQTFSIPTELASTQLDYRVNQLTLPVPVPRLERLTQAGGLARLPFTAQPGLLYSVECRNSLRTGSWSALTNIGPLSEETALVVTDSLGGQPQRFYRLNASVPTQPAAAVSVEQAQACYELDFTGTPGQPYTVEYREALNSGSWQTLTNITGPAGATNIVVHDYETGRAQRFYRVRSP